MGLNAWFTVLIAVSLGTVLFVSNQDHSALLHLALCASTALIVLYVSRTRAEYLWVGALGGIALILIPLSPVAGESSRLWPDVVCVAVFVAYYKLCVAKHQMSMPSGRAHSRGQ
jgi:hypothetical protein